MKVVGLTGNSGVGKTVLCEILKRKYDIKIINADEIARQLTQESTEYLENIVKEFGQDILNANGKLNRKKLANIIYKNEEERTKLNNLTFIYVVDEIKRKINNIKEGNTVVIDAPLLFESGLDKICDITIAMIAKKDVKLKRICIRDAVELSVAESRINIQLKDGYLSQKADYVIENNGTLSQLEKVIEDMQIFT